MTRLYIRNIGPIKEIDLELKPVMVFIGPQSSGKSTLAKIISFCSWLEKDAVSRQSISYVDMEFVKTELLAFHKLENYINEDSFIKYESNVISFECDFKNLSLKRSEGFAEAFDGKIAYIPSERHVVNLPGIQSLSFKKNNIRSFVFDWFDSHANFTKEKPLELDGLNAKYYYDDAKEQDVIEMNDGKVLPLDDASSGLQSSTPLYVYLKYLTKWIFENTQKISYEKEQRLQNALDIKYADTALRKKRSKSLDNPDEVYSNATFKQIARDLRLVISEMKSSDSPTEEVTDYLQTFLDIDESLSRPHYTKIIIEEPEQNLFPETQSRLVRYIFKQIQAGRDNIVITTHSPYILSTLNNLIYAYNIGQEFREDVGAIIPSDVWVNYDDVAAYMLSKGTLVSMMDDELKQLKAEMIDEVSSELNEEYERLLDIEVRES